MSFEDSADYDVDVEAFFDLLCDADTTVARYGNAGDRDIEVLQNAADGDGFVIRTRRTVEVDIPGFAKKVLQPTNTMTQVDTWSGPDATGVRTGTFDVDVKGAPVHFSGTMRLEPRGDDACRYSVRGEAKVSIPLVGGRIAKWAEGTARDTLKGELDFNRAALEGR